MSTRKAPQYDEGQVNHWLAWLAKNMQRHDQTLFLIENLQPSWLQSRGEMRAFSVWAHIIWGMWAALMLGLLAGLSIQWPRGVIGSDLYIRQISGPVANLVGEIPFWFLFGLLWGLIYGLIFGIVDVVFSRDGGVPKKMYVTVTSRAMVNAALQYSLISGLISLGAVFVNRYFTAGILRQEEQMPRLVIALIAYGVIFGCIYFLRSKTRSLSTAIRFVETLIWSNRTAVHATTQGVAIGFIIGALAGLLLGLIDGWSSGLEAAITTGLEAASQLGLIFGLITGILGMAIGGFTPVIRDLKTEPNQGTRLSIRNALRVGGFGGLAAALFVGIVLLPGCSVSGCWRMMPLFYGAVTAIVVAGWYGAIDAIEHGILRLILWRKGYAPLNYAEFLDYAADELNFLQKVGGGYIFIHRYLLEYFASMADEPVSETESTAQTVAAGDD